MQIERLPLRHEQDVVAARRRARQIAASVGFDNQDQARVATAVSEIARNAVRYARDGRVEFELEGERAPQMLMIRISDRGPGIPDLEPILEGRYRSHTGVGLGIVGARRLMDQCDIASDAHGTVVLMKKLLDANLPLLTPATVEQLRAKLARESASDPVAELQQQQRELLVALADARERQEQLFELNRELEDTNRGVVALYAELDEKADHLRRADEMKSRFLSNMSHEFRTPLNSIRALTGLLLDRVDGALSLEQERQVTLIRKATDDLSNLVEDLLDIGRIEAGKLDIHPSEFDVDDLFSALRGMLRPLLVGDEVVLRFESPVDIPPLLGDEAKVSQILRNFISNALKFTEHGAVTVRASFSGADDTVTFCVEDTGIGIAAEDQERIFEEFVQVRSPLQKRVKGTGLGLPLCRRLAHALGGEVRVESEPGVGSRFYLTVPHRHADDGGTAPPAPASAPSESWRIPVLIVEDDRDMRLFYERSLQATAYRFVPASTLHQASAALERERPAAVVLDIPVGDEDVWRWLAELRGNRDLHATAVLVMSTVDEEPRALALGADAFVRKPLDGRALVERLDAATASRVLVIEDDATTRYAMRKLLQGSDFLVLEAANGEDGLRAAEAALPRAIILDLGLPDVDGFALLDRLSVSSSARHVPVIVATARDLSDVERERLEARAFAVLTKRDMLGRIVSAVAAACGDAASEGLPSS
jgi:signal transduction histidine kinase/DNA-binding response OmpR family regulator